VWCTIARCGVVALLCSVSLPKMRSQCLLCGVPLPDVEWLPCCVVFHYQKCGVRFCCVVFHYQNCGVRVCCVVFHCQNCVVGVCCVVFHYQNCVVSVCCVVFHCQNCVVSVCCVVFHYQYLTEIQKRRKTRGCGKLTIPPLAQHGKPDQTASLSYHVGVGSTTQMAYRRS
jgi:hypothetical protein